MHLGREERHRRAHITERRTANAAPDLHAGSSWARAMRVIDFRAGASPRMARLTTALEHVQLSADVRRTVPLSLRLVRLGGEAMIPALVRALRAVLGGKQEAGVRIQE